MNDFDYEVLQRKRLARQSSHRKCGSRSKKCPMSTDRMTRKQWEERCGELVTYQLGKPISWDEFRQMPPDIQKKYLLDMIDRYSTTASDLARMFGITPKTVTRFCGSREISIEFSRGKRMPKDRRVEFEKLLSGDDGTSAPNVQETESELDMRMVVDKPGKCMDMTAFSLCFEGILQPEMITNSIIAMLRPGSAVKIEVRCSVLP